MTITQLMKELRQHQVVLRLEQEKLFCELPKQGIPAVLREALIARKQELKAYIASMAIEKHTSVVIPRRPTGQSSELLSFAQQSLWMLDQFKEGSAHYNMPNALKLSGTLNIQALNQAITTIFERHESLRSCFTIDKDGQPIQVIKPIFEFAIVEQDLSNLEEGVRQLKIAELINNEAACPFDLSKDLMLRAHLFKVSESEYILSVTMHHIASDGWSVTILIKEFATLYSAYTQGLANPLVPLEIQYADYCHWERNWLQKEILDKQLGYWEQQLQDLPLVHGVPLDYPRPALQTTVGDTYTSHIDALTSKALNTICHANSATLYMGLHAAFATFLSRYSNELDIVIGTAIANREQPEITGMIGYFINILVLRSNLSNNPSFIDLLQQSKAMLLDAYAHQQVPFSQVIDRLPTERNLSFSPLCQIMLILQNTEEITLELPNLTLSSVHQANMTAKHDLTLYVTECAEGLNLSWEYNTDLFMPSTIERMAKHFELLLKSLLSKPEDNVFKAAMLTEIEKHQVLVEWNNTRVDYPKHKCIQQLFEEQVEAVPNAIALMFEGQELTYAELNAKANQLAHYLIAEKGVKPDTLVGIFIERSLDMVVAILGILKAGAAYVPLDINYPKSRLAYMLDDANLLTVITQSYLLVDSPIRETQALCLDDVGVTEQLKKHVTTNVIVNNIGLNSNHLAYVIYTSGSTGNPKGVMVCHNSLVNLVLALAHRYSLTNEDSVLQFAPISFDMSVEEIFGALCAGCRLVMRNDEWLDSANTFYSHCQNAGITVLNLPTAFWHELARDNTPFTAHRVRHISVGGEKINEIEIQNWFKKGVNLPRLLDAYGPTECTVNASFADVQQNYKSNIGIALSNINLYVLNPQLQPTAVNVGGELHVGGVGLARGYLNRTELTNEKFIPNPFCDKTHPNSNERLYKTGDLVRWRPDGTLEFLGRIDHQVKIRGFRIELGEIENALAAHVNVKEALVLARDSFNNTDKKLVAYVVTDVAGINDGSDAGVTACQLLIETLCQYLNQSLPDYMVPTAFVILERLPLTPNGKIDRKALPEPDMLQLQISYTAPRNDIEKMISEIWQEVLSVKRVGINDNFFQLGGHSLLAIRALSKINAEFQTNLSLKSLFSDATVLGVATHIETVKLNDSNLAQILNDELAEEGFF